MKVTRTSMISGKTNTLDIEITEEDLQRYVNGVAGLIQEAFPDLPPPLREFILTGVTPEEWAAVVIGTLEEEEWEEEDEGA